MLWQDEPVCCDVSSRRASRSNGFDLPNMGNADKSHLQGNRFLPRVGNREFRPPSPPNARDRFDIHWMRHTGKWWRLYTDVHLAEALRILETDGHLHPV
jgi:hypothetical protein